MELGLSFSQIWIWMENNAEYGKIIVFPDFIFYSII